VEQQIETQQEKIRKLEERIAGLMTQRVIEEEKLAELLLEQRKNP